MVYEDWVIHLDPTIYELLASQQASATTVTQLDSATKNTFIDSTNIEFWSGMIEVAEMMNKSRTFAHGIPIPESGTVFTQAVADSGNVQVKPTGSSSEVWRVENVTPDSCTVMLADGTSTSTIDLDKNPPPFFITPTLFFIIVNSSGGEKNPSIAYSKVSM